ncbi:MAG: formate dehydrogenase subunit gamma, partial [Ignavibacteriaceae bacterium]
YYEAWLAFLAIVVWHFYFTIFNPDIYPMNTSWITGKITEEEMAEEHPAELEKIKQKQFEQEKGK